MRKYKNLPHPSREVEAFNQYLRDNNEVVGELDYFLIIKNSYIPRQFVSFCKLPVKDLKQLFDYTEDKSDLWNKVRNEFLAHFITYGDKHIYINEPKDKSVPDRFHLHIKL